MKSLLWSSEVNLSDWTDALKEYCEDTGIEFDTMSEAERYDIAYSLNAETLDDERANLDIPLRGRILVIGDLGLWSGRVPAYKIIGGNVANIFDAAVGDDIEWYADAYNIRATVAHHDGVNYYLYREIKPGVNITPLLDRIYSGEKVGTDTISRYTRSLRPYVAEVYGWDGKKTGGKI